MPEQGLELNIRNDLTPIADKFGVKVNLLEQLQQAMSPFSADYRRPADVIRYFAQRQEVLKEESTYLWRLKTGDFLRQDCGSDCGKATAKYAIHLRDEYPDLMEEFLGYGFVLAYIENATAPHVFKKGSHQILSLFKNSEYYGIALDPAFGCVGIAGTPPDSQYQVLSQPARMNYESQFEDDKTIELGYGSARLLRSVRELILGLSKRIDIVYMLGMTYEMGTKISRPFITAIPADESTSAVFLMYSSREFALLDEGLNSKLSPYQRHLMEQDVLELCARFHEKEKSPRVLKPKRRN